MLSRPADMDTTDYCTEADRLRSVRVVILPADFQAATGASRQTVARWCEPGRLPLAAWRAACWLRGVVEVAGMVWRICRAQGALVMPTGDALPLAEVIGWPTMRAAHRARERQLQAARAEIERLRAEISALKRQRGTGWRRAANDEWGDGPTPPRPAVSGRR